MANTKTTVSQRWSSRYAYILAATGAAVGLGNIWKFPYIMGENGGGAFVLVYLVCILFIGIPVMMAEVAVGKRGRSSPAHAVAKVATGCGRSRHWSVLGGVAVLTGFLILSFYIVIAGWALAYSYYSISGDIAAAAGDAKRLGDMFSSLVSDPVRLIGWSAALLGGASWVIAKGVNQGLERAISAMMPALFVLLAIIMVYAAMTGDFARAAAFMFQPDFSKLTVKGVLIALGHAFFTLSLSSGIMMVYGAYLPEGTSIVKTSLWIAVCDTLVALMAGMAIYPVVFAHGLEPSAGPGLLFQSLPISLGQMPAATLFSTLFFVMVVFAAFTSAIALLEASVAYLVERRGMHRVSAAWLTGLVIWVLSLMTVFSFAGAGWATPDLGFFGSSLFDMLDTLTSKILMPLGGMAMAVFVGWILDEKVFREELAVSQWLHGVCRFSLRYLSPVAIGIVFLQLIGIIDI